MSSFLFADTTITPFSIPFRASEQGRREGREGGEGKGGEGGGGIGGGKEGGAWV